MKKCEDLHLDPNPLKFTEAQLLEIAKQGPHFSTVRYSLNEVSKNFFQNSTIDEDVDISDNNYVQLNRTNMTNFFFFFFFDRSDQS